MYNVIIIVEMIFNIIIGIYFFYALKNQQFGRISIDKENKKELEKLNDMRKIRLSIPLCEESRPKSFDEIIGQKNGIKTLKASICGPNPQHVIIYGPPGVGKTAAARLALEYAKTCAFSPFNDKAKFVEIDATTLRFDERGIADPLIGSVHDPIYQGAGKFGNAGIPQPKMGAVSRAHGGVLFIDEIGELNPIEMNKLLKVMEDRKVFFDSAYYNSSSENMPEYIREVFEEGFPADFRLIGATTKNPEEINPAIRSRCIEIFFRALDAEEIKIIAKNAVEKINVNIDSKALELIAMYSSNGRDVINLIQLACGIVINENRGRIEAEDILWIAENGRYSLRSYKKLSSVSRIGCVNGLGVFGIDNGIVMDVEATAVRVENSVGQIKITGIIEEEEISGYNKKVKKKSSIMASAENAISMIENVFNINIKNYDIHIDFQGGYAVDGPSAGVSIACAIFSALKKLPIKSKVAMTGEITLNGIVKPVGGVSSKVTAAAKAGAELVIIPYDNWNKSFDSYSNIKVIGVKNIKEILSYVLVKKECNDKSIELNKKNTKSVLTADGINMNEYNF
ncbi:Lon-like ATP-dependent protease [Clostridium acetobutylicum]|uniref:endopeptidase La n=1 Tax=Clostridium acetobutylicum (strain ATCC 824 / DSM 792 / JCM 1419 / IAM 19013 / LMG 5710 / NBRC 13948 / NRRL B-527 / VKM B-1787 / 2291 / W) TaxID=272562 RepID=Q97FT8_CLOAB|nr:MULTISPECIES: ATP-dependent protease LonB [Clostridium]AAK80585.1 Lon-like ATP-dependent protease [Clostridium acetobutylicum ATCC 824]ADZ21684.1 Lon-like ATP-dependent protease [Clostridium acetobutylicum EA 2018]AEI34007.1 Lon-like ATP-dependent protease [Clostridium acetobutylicum DSM 1731]AWV78998.1 ATP-dependent protease LonB [Clostridium acetobutylicum]MBC2395042.1 ATP-dependent protease LonB [Clostridium acetobutylicum]